jgi:hypothetical protein
MLQLSEPDWCAWLDVYIAKIKLEMTFFGSSRRDLGGPAGPFKNAKLTEPRKLSQLDTSVWQKNSVIPFQGWWIAKENFYFYLIL